MKKEKRDPMDGEYIGNIFGWKLSLLGAGIILFLVALLAFRHWYYEIPLGFEDPLAPTTETPADTLRSGNE